MVHTVVSTPFEEPTQNELEILGFLISNIPPYMTDQFVFLHEMAEALDRDLHGLGQVVGNLCRKGILGRNVRRVPTEDTEKGYHTYRVTWLIDRDQYAS